MACIEQEQREVCGPFFGVPMSIGTAIFLSSLFLGLVALFAATKDRWRWGQFVKRLALTVASILLLAALAWGGVYLWSIMPITVAQQTE